jgi:hypothetical protein
MIKSEKLDPEGAKRIILSKTDALLKRTHGIADGLDEIGRLLARLDPAESPVYEAIDHKGQDFSTYFVAAYSETHDFERSMLAYRTVKSLVRYILLMDRFFEVGNKEYGAMAKGLLQSIKKAHKGHLKYSIDFALKQFWPFWSFEQLMKKHLDRGDSFSVKELRHFNLFKSSDAPIIYAKVLDSDLAGFDPNISLIIHYNQALEDIQDDLEDIEEDVREQMPSIFILAATSHIPLAKLRKNPAQARKLILSSGALDSVLYIVEQYTKLANDIPVPKSYQFLKHLAKDYAGRIYRDLGISPSDSRGVPHNFIPTPASVSAFAP